MGRIALTADYMPPEMVEEVEYDNKVDVWSLGVMALEMMSLEHPFEDEEDEVVEEKILSGDYAVKARLEKTDM